jgi:hypothetical protein
VDDELDYAQMLEIPVNTVNVVKKTGIFKKRKDKDDLKDRVIEKVNCRADRRECAACDGNMGDGMKEDNLASTLQSGNNGSFGNGEYDFLRTENISDMPKVEVNEKMDKAGKILFGETIAACLIAGGIFLTNIFLPTTAINTFVGSLTETAEEEAAYNEFTLSSVVSELSDVTVTKTSDGVICFTDKTLVYPVCSGEVANVSESNGLYTVKIAHTSTFSSVVTGLTQVYSSVGESVASNVPFAYSAGDNEVRVSMYDGETLLSCYTLSGVVPVWTA